MGTFVKGIYGATDASGWAHYDFTGGGPTGTIICVAATGSDSNPGTFASPYLTLGQGAAKLASLGNGEHWLLVRKGDTFVCDDASHDTFGSNPWTIKGTSATNPIVVSTYDGSIDPATSGFNPTTGGARPIIKMGQGAPNKSFINFTGGNNGGTNTAVIGFDVIAYKRNPNDANFAPNGQNISAGGAGQTFTDLYWEDCRFQYMVSGPDFNDPNVSSTNLTVRRCQIAYTYHQDLFAQGCHAQGVHGTVTFEENVVHMSGWLRDLQTPQTCGITNGSPAVISWLGSYPSPLANDLSVYFLPGTGGSDVLPTGITSAGTGTNGQPTAGDVAPHQTYFVINYTPGSPPTFNVSLTQGGSPVNTSSAGVGTPTICWNYADVGWRQFAHNIYFQEEQTAGAGVPAIVRGNIISYDSGASQIRSGYFVDNNLWLRNPISHNFAQPFVTTYTISNNVHLEQVGLPTIPSPTTSGFGLGLDVAGSVPASPITISGNIFANKISGNNGAISLGQGQTGDTLTNNIVYNWTGSPSVSLSNGSVLTMSLNTAGSGGTGAIANFYTTFNNGTLGTGTPGGPYTNLALSGGTGAGATIDITVDADGTVHSSGIHTPPYSSDITTHAATDWGGGGWKLNNPGTGYSSGDVLTCADGRVPTGFSVTVGPYPQYANDAATGITTTGGSGDGNLNIYVFFATSGAVTSATSALVFGQIPAPGYMGGLNYVVGDVVNAATINGIVGAKFNVTAVTNNTETGTQLDVSGTNNNPGGTAPAEPFPLHGGGTPGGIGNNNVGYYYGTLGGSPATTDGFLAAVINNNKVGWNSNLTANNANIYIRAGFGIGGGGPDPITPPSHQKDGKHTGRRIKIPQI